MRELAVRGARSEEQCLPIARQAEHFDNVGELVAVQLAVFAESKLGLNGAHRLYVFASLELTLIWFAVRKVEGRHLDGRLLRLQMSLLGAEFVARDGRAGRRLLLLLGLVV